jgi:hypothetical protein
MTLAHACSTAVNLRLRPFRHTGKGCCTSGSVVLVLTGRSRGYMTAPKVHYPELVPRRFGLMMSTECRTCRSFETRQTRSYRIDTIYAHECYYRKYVKLADDSVSQPREPCT